MLASGFALLTLALAQLTAAHFLLNYPTSIGFDDDLESTSPCGGFSPNSTDSMTNLTIGGFSVSIRSTHPQADWLYRVTTEVDGLSNWTNVLPVVQEVGIGDFCLTDLTLDSSWEGKAGVLQVIQDAVDGSLYQCAMVNFVSGTNTSVGSGCTNATGITITVTDQEDFNSTSNGSTSTASASATSTTVTASSSSSASSSSGSSKVFHQVAISTLIISSLVMGLFVVVT